MFLGIASTTGALLAFCSASAAASEIHGFAESFGMPGSGAGQLALSAPTLSAGKPISAGSGVGVNDESGEIYVADSANHRVSQFDPVKPPAERFVRMFGADVNKTAVAESRNSETDVCPAAGHPGDECQAGTSGSAPGELTTPTFIAVDNSGGLSRGDVYVADSAGTEQRVTKFGPEGELIASWGAGGQLDGSSTPRGLFEEIEGIDTSATGSLWVRGGEMFEFSQSGIFEGEWSPALGAQPTGIALDGAEPERIYLLAGFPWGPIHRFSTVGADEGAALGVEGGFFTDIVANKRTHELFADQQGVSIAAVSPQCIPSKAGTAGPCAPTQVFGEGELAMGAGLGVNSASGTIYAASSEKDEVDVFPVTLEGEAEAASAVGATSVTLHGEVKPKGSPVVHCAFQYGENDSYGQEASCLNAKDEVVGTSSKPIEVETEVHAQPSGLNGGTLYHFRLRLGDEASEFLSSEDKTFATLAIAVVSEVKEQPLDGGRVGLSARVNPRGVASTECQLEWGTSSGPPYEHTVPCEPPMPSGSIPVAVSVQLSGLDTHVTYHFNFSVKDENGTTQAVDHSFILEPVVKPGVKFGDDCPNKALRQVNDSVGLPDCRAYELVTPTKKNAALVGALLFNNIPPQIAANGQRVIAPSIQCFGETPSCVGTRLAEGEPFQFERTALGWSAKPLALPASVYETSSSWGFSAETGAVLFGSPSSPEGPDDLYVRDAEGSLSNLGPAWGPGFSLHQFIFQPIVGTADFSHVLYMMSVPAWPFDAGESSAASLYEYPGVDGSSVEPQIVAVSGGEGSHDLISTCGSTVAGFETLSQTYGSVSADGKTTYFQAAPCKHGAGVNAGREVPSYELFARIDGEGPGARTVVISEPAALSPPQADPECKSSQCIENTTQAKNFRGAEFEGASTDGTIAYFTSPQQLTDRASQDKNANDSAHLGGCSVIQGANGCNLYVFTDPQQTPLAGTHLLDVSAGDTSGIGPEVQGMLALSSDGSHAYFVAKGLLSEAPNAEGERASEGANNLYLYEAPDEAHPQGRLRFVARLSSVEKRSWSSGVDTANASPDGRYLIFESSRGLGTGALAEGPRQIYRYDALTGHIERISFGRAGYNDDGNAGGPGADASIAGAWKATLHRAGPVRSDPTMADDGSIVFFQSPVSLVPGASSEVVVDEAGVKEGRPVKFAQNVYEWEAQGRGGCEEINGCIYLISDGKDSAESGKTVEDAVELLGTDTSGQNVFFATTNRLVPADSDTGRDYYDARVEGGFPVATTLENCEGDSCHPPTSQPPISAPLGSLEFVGPSNPIAIAETIKSTPSNKPLSKVQLLIKALKRCKRKKVRKKRLACERVAHKQYGAKSKKKTNAKKKAHEKGKR